ncbi:MAG: hypothetical protein ACAH95_05845 [Fimbriimonas sp.]
MSSALVGCSGDATVGPDPGTPVIPASGGVPQNTGTSNETRGATEQPQQVQVTVGGGPQSASLPGGISLTTGEQVALFPAGQVILQGLSTIGGGNVAHQTRQEAGEIWVRDHNSNVSYYSGVKVTTSGTLSGPFVLPNGDYEIFMHGPFTISNGGQILNVQTIILDGQVRNGVASVPMTISGQLPVNGGSSYPLRLDIQLPSQFAVGFVDLRVVHANGILHQDKTLNNGHAQFHDLTFSGNSVIPAVGLQTVEFRYSDTPFND